jgi:hypothetical protein
METRNWSYERVAELLGFARLGRARAPAPTWAQVGRGRSLFRGSGACLSDHDRVLHLAKKISDG